MKELAPETSLCHPQILCAELSGPWSAGCFLHPELWGSEVSPAAPLWVLCWWLGSALCRASCAELLPCTDCRRVQGVETGIGAF